MVYQRIFQGVMLLFLAGTGFAACDSEPQTPQDQYCATKCSCNKCTPTETSTCTNDMLNLEEQAKGADCKDPYDTFLSCLNDNGKCVDGDFDESGCFNEETDLRTCIKPLPMCPTVNDGKCNEPAPVGDGTCVTGTDTKDCMPAPCPTTQDGKCDEPEGTNTCAEGTDIVDCPCKKCLMHAQNQSGGQVCTASNAIFSSLRTCTCDIATCLGPCGAIGDFCEFGQMSDACLMCITMQCMSEYNACSADG